MLAYLVIAFFVCALLAAAFFIYKNTIGKKRRSTLKEDYEKEAERHERSGRLISAAAIYEGQLRNKGKAAELYEKGADYRRAAALYDMLGMPDKAREMYEKDGDMESAAVVAMLQGNYEEAARLYDSAGKKIDAAIMLDKAGRRMAAVRIYREAGEYKKASQLLEEEGMPKEAAEMFGIFLRDKQVEEHTEDFYAYALKLAHAGETQAAIEIFRMIDIASPFFRDVKDRLASLIS
ncbi:MAG TPA: hypothetical protein VEE82_03905, partial [Thermodesulfovibrionales bacterium]|nr:hypothetical protein [Thermodesulfovibrionales bacterium]